MSTQRSPITSHILDITAGKPAVGVEVELDKREAAVWKRLASGKTNADGRVEQLLTPGSKAEPGTYCLRFKTAPYFKNETFYPFVEIVFEIKSPDQHYHVPLLISPYGYSTYRGS